MTIIGRLVNESLPACAESAVNTNLSPLYSQKHTITQILIYSQEGEIGFNQK